MKIFSLIIPIFLLGTGLILTGLGNFYGIVLLLGGTLLNLIIEGHKDYN